MTDNRNHPRYDDFYPVGQFDLAATLAAVRAVRDGAVGAETGKLMDRATDELAALDLVKDVPAAGEIAPSFELPNAVGSRVSLAQLLAAGPVVISFYRGIWCPYCNLEQRALQQHLPEITEMGGSLVSISPQNPDDSLTMAERNELTFEVLSDAGAAVAKSYGLAFDLPPYLQEVYTHMNHPLPDFNGADNWTLPIPATFVVDAGGVIRYRFADPDYTRRADPADVLAALREIRSSG